MFARCGSGVLHGCSGLATKELLRVGYDMCWDDGEEVKESNKNWNCYKRFEALFVAWLGKR